MLNSAVVEAFFSCFARQGVRGLLPTSYGGRVMGGCCSSNMMVMQMFVFVCMWISVSQGEEIQYNHWPNIISLISDNSHFLESKLEPVFHLEVALLSHPPDLSSSLCVDCMEQGPLIPKGTFLHAHRRKLQRRTPCPRWGVACTAASFVMIEDARP